MPFRTVEVEVDEDDKVIGQNVSSQPFDTQAEADAGTKRRAEAFGNHGHDAEHGLWWARDPSGRKFHIFTEGY